MCKKKKASEHGKAEKAVRINAVGSGKISKKKKRV